MKLRPILSILLFSLLAEVKVGATRKTKKGLTFLEPTKKIDFVNGESYPNCGKVPANCERGINKEALPGCNPWHVKVHRRGSKEDCDGTLISKRAVVTRAQCVFRQLNLLKPSEIQITLGAFNISDPDETNKQIINATTLIPHPDFPNFCILCAEYDIALILLEENSVQINEHVSPICLWNEDFDPRNFVNTVGEASAWKPKDNVIAGGNLQQNFLKVISYEDCYNTFHDEIKPHKNFCSRHVSTQNTACNIESGAGFVTKKDGRRFLRGLLDSYNGKQRTEEGYCKSTKEIGFENILVVEDLAAYMGWIIDNVPDISKL